MTKRRRLQIELLEARDVPSALGLLAGAGGVHNPPKLPFGGPGAKHPIPPVVSPLNTTGLHQNGGITIQAGGVHTPKGFPHPFGGPASHTLNPEIV